MTHPLDGMTATVWARLSPVERDRLQDRSGLHPVLRDLRGHRVEVEYYGERRRFIVGQSTGWRPVTLGLHNRRSMGSSHLLTAENCKFATQVDR